MTQNQDFAPFTKANHHLANAKHRSQLQKRSLGNVSSQREKGKAASAKARKPFFIYLVLINREDNLWNTSSWRNLMNSFCIKRLNQALIEGRATAGDATGPGTATQPTDNSSQFLGGKPSRKTWESQKAPAILSAFWFIPTHPPTCHGRGGCNCYI